MNRLMIPTFRAASHYRRSNRTALPRDVTSCRASAPSRYPLEMHVIQPARLKPGVSLETVDPDAAAPIERAPAAPLIRGRALIFWDLKVPGQKKKLDAI